MNIERKCQIRHTVAPGETLSQILRRYYGPHATEKLVVVYEANKELFLKFPNELQPGSELLLPEIDKRDD